jgi:gliding motility-associated-like protein
VYFTGDQVIDETTLIPQTPGNQPFTINLVDEFGCRYDTTVHVVTHAWPEVSLGDSRKICNGHSVTLTPDNPNNAYNYLWNTGATTAAISVSDPGVYSLAARVIKSGEILCQSSDTVEVQESAAITTSVNDEVCAGTDYNGYDFHITAADMGVNDLYSTTRTLTAQNGCDSMVTLSLTILPSTTEHTEVAACEQFFWEGETYTESGEYTRAYTNSHGCDSVLTLRLNIGHPSEYEIWKTSCGTYYWNNSALSESGDYTNTFTSTSNCDSIVTLHLTIVDTVLRSYNSNPDFCNTEETTLSVEGDFDSYIWNTGEVGPSINVTASGFYSVTASNEVCERTAKFQIPHCLPHLYLPTAITPGKADGLNDYLSLSDYDKSQISEFNIDIYNRWGELVFTSNDKNFRWDGSRNGKYFIDTVYNYVLRYTDHHGKPYRILGNITVL